MLNKPSMKLTGFERRSKVIYWPTVEFYEEILKKLHYWALESIDLVIQKNQRIVAFCLGDVDRSVTGSVCFTMQGFWLEEVESMLFSYTCSCSTIKFADS